MAWNASAIIAILVLRYERQHDNSPGLPQFHVMLLLAKWHCNFDSTFRHCIHSFYLLTVELYHTPHITTWWYLSAPTVDLARSCSSWEGSAPSDKMKRIGSDACVSFCMIWSKLRFGGDNSFRPVHKRHKSIYTRAPTMLFLSSNCENCVTVVLMVKKNTKLISTVIIASTGGQNQTWLAVNQLISTFL